MRAGIIAILLLMLSLAPLSTQSLSIPAPEAHADLPTPPPFGAGAFCDHVTKRCADPDVSSLGMEPLVGVVLVQPFQPTSRPTSQGTAGNAGNSTGDGAACPDRSFGNGSPRENGNAGNNTGNAEASDNAGGRGCGIGPPRSGNETGGGGGGNETPTAPFVACSDPRGCPDLTVDAADLLEGGISNETFADDDCNVVEGSTEAGARRLLRFSSTTPNQGQGDLILGNPASHLDWFEYSSCHRHYHFNEYADYRLWTVEGYLDWRDAREADHNATAQQVLDGHPDLAAGFVEGRKQGFCAIDLIQVVPFSPSHYWGCSNQGISVGWADKYHYLLDGQFIDVTDVAPGHYVLEVETNAERFFAESDYSNNAAAVLVAIGVPLPTIPDIEELLDRVLA